MNTFTIDAVMIKVLTLMGPYWNFFSYIVECCLKVYIAARTDTIQQTNFCLGLHLQTCVATFNLTYLIKGEYLVRNTTNSEQMVYSVILKVHVSALIGHLQVSTVL